MSEQAEYIVKEHRASGQVKGQVYTRYLTAYKNPHLWLPLILLFLLTQTFMPSAFRWLVGAWLEDCSTAQCRERLAYVWSQQLRDLAPEQTLSFLFALVFSGMIITGISWFIERLYLNLGAMTLHRKMVRSFQQVKVSFFDQNPSGRLIRRFSSDYSAMLNEIPEQISSIASCLLALVWAIVMAAIEAPPVIIVCIPCAWFYFKLQDIYRPASRETQRLAKVLESPIWSLFSETIRGFQVVRAFNKDEIFSQRMNKLFDSFGKAFFLRGRMTRWLTLRLKLVAEVFSLACTIYSIYAVSQGMIGIGTAGFLMSLAIGLDGTMQWLTRAFAELETSMVSVERIIEYQDLEDEQNSEKITAEVADDYPLQGKVEFKDYTMSYRDDSDLVLKNLTVSIPTGSKIGIMGRTGAGKSSLFQALFRMVHRVDGDIIIDGTSIHSIPVERLRQVFGIVPQEPHLFSGTIRSNLDRTASQSDEKIWEALKVSGLEPLIRKMENGLDTVVKDEGSNLSVGQRQLLCMARAILNHAQIILMDEATANVDGETDQLIHQAMDIAFKDRTILIIAHRLSTIEDCDFILPIDNGTTEGLIKPEQAMKMVAEDQAWSE